MEISLEPADPAAYDEGIASVLTVEINASKLTWKNYLGVRPATTLTTKRDMFVPATGRELAWNFTASQDFEYRSPDCNYEPSGARATCTVAWRAGEAGVPVRVDPWPHAVPTDPARRADFASQIQVSFDVRFPTLAVSREELDGTPVDYSELDWRPADEMNLLYPDPAKVDVDEFFSGEYGDSYPELRALSGRADAIELSVCPSCMALQGYSCADELAKATYMCFGPATEPQRISWAAERVDLAWERSASDWGLAGLIGTGAIAVGASLLRRRRQGPRSDTAGAADHLQTKTVVELRYLAARARIPKYASLRKQALIDELTRRAPK